MIYFESNINYPYQQSTGHINIDNGQIHYSISSNRQQSRWFVAVSIVYNDNTGSVHPKPELGFQTESYGNILTYISKLPTYLKTQTTQGNTLQEEMYKDFYRICDKANEIFDALALFRRKWMPNEKEINTCNPAKASALSDKGISASNILQEDTYPSIQETVKEIDRNRS